jgi:branched-chain amino acid transport system substrate-binding protein
MRRLATALVLAVAMAGTAAGGRGVPLVLGAVYPTVGPQAGPGGGNDEYRGLVLAAEYVNRHGGVKGRPVAITLVPVASPEAAPGAVEQLAESGVSVVVGSYGSVVARAAAPVAARHGLVYWETGAVGDVGGDAAPGRSFFRVAPSGVLLGRRAVEFVRDRLAPRLRRPGPLRYTVAYVDDAFGRAEARGEVAEIRRSRLPLAAVLPYDPWHVDYAALARRIAHARTDVLIVASYMEDAVELRRALLRARVPLAVNIGGCSAYVIPEFGRRLGPAAVGVFSSDKTGDLLPPRALVPEAAQELLWARREFQRRYGHPLWEPGLSGFSGGIALLRWVLPAARDFSPPAVAESALRANLPLGSLPNGSGLLFGAQGTPQAGENLRAASVIWEWVAPYTRALVWPPALATHPILFP